MTGLRIGEMLTDYEFEKWCIDQKLPELTVKTIKEINFKYRAVAPSK
jgi:hypothetical protein